MPWRRIKDIQSTGLQPTAGISGCPAVLRATQSHPAPLEQHTLQAAVPPKQSMPTCILPARSSAGHTAQPAAQNLPAHQHSALSASPEPVPSVCSPGTAFGTASPRPCRRSRCAAFASPSRAPTWPERRGCQRAPERHIPGIPPSCSRVSPRADPGDPGMLSRSSQAAPASSSQAPQDALLLLPGTPRCSPLFLGTRDALPLLPGCSPASSRVPGMLSRSSRAAPPGVCPPPQHSLPSRAICSPQPGDPEPAGARAAPAERLECGGARECSLGISAC